jgi:hypothetical protein
MTTNSSRREKDDNYDSVVAMLGPTCRVIACKDARGDSSRCIRCQFGNDRHCFAFERRAPGKIAGQRCGERFSRSREARTVPHPAPACGRAADTFRKRGSRLNNSPTSSIFTRARPEVIFGLDHCIMEEKS